MTKGSVEINLWAGLRRFADNREKVTVEASTIGQALDALVAQYPGLEPVIEAGVSVAVDGEIVTGGHHREIEPGTEIFLLQQLKGG